MAAGRERLTSAISDETNTFQFTFSVPVPKFNPNSYQRPEKLEPSSDNSTPDSSSSQQLFSLLPGSHDGERSDESDVEEDHVNDVQAVDTKNAHAVSLHLNASDKQEKDKPKILVRSLRTRSILLSDDNASVKKSQPEKGRRKRSASTPKTESIEPKRQIVSRSSSFDPPLQSSSEEEEVNRKMEEHDTLIIPTAKIRRSWRSEYVEVSDGSDAKAIERRYTFGKSDKPDSSQSTKSIHTDFEFSAEYSHLEFRSGYDYFVGVSEDENDNYGYHGSDEEEEDSRGVGHILDASDALKMIKQRRQERISKDQTKACVQSSDSLPPSSPVPVKKQHKSVIPTSKSQEDFCYVDSDCEEPLPPQLPESHDDGRKLVYVFRGQKYHTDVDLTDIPWAAGDSEDDDDLQQIRYKPRVLWPDHPEDVNSRIKLRQPQANSRLL